MNPPVSYAAMPCGSRGARSAVHEARPPEPARPRLLDRVREVLAVLRPLQGVPRLMAYLLYGSGLCLLECCRLRVQDVDFAANQIVVRGAKGDKDRVTMLPAAIKAAVARQIEDVRAQHQRDLRDGAGWVELPTALVRTHPNAGREWVWQRAEPRAFRRAEPARHDARRLTLPG